MPRIYNSASEPIDLCNNCFPNGEVADHKYNQPTKIGLRDGNENGYGYDSEHPPYENEDYTCDECDELLTEEDN